MIENKVPLSEITASLGRTEQEVSLEMRVKVIHMYYGESQCTLNDLVEYFDPYLNETKLEKALGMHPEFRVLFTFRDSLKGKASAEEFSKLTGWMDDFIEQTMLRKYANRS